MSRSSLAIRLSAIKGFIDPKVRVEQYMTDSEIAATVLWDAYMKGDIEGKVIADLGCGTGILGIGAMMLGASKAYLVESDGSAIAIAKENVRDMESEGLIKKAGKKGEKGKEESESEGSAEFFFGDVSDFKIKADTVIMNPPFGVKSEHSDRRFLEKAFEISDVVYSFHKSGTVRFVEMLAKAKGFRITQVIDLKFPLKASMRFHKKRIERIGVSCLRMEKIA
ncbi:METTL5 family protein [Candidatus Woesearchaeota archaeon]|nr:METTL5 family protein [Candidatus Woesearchaeota archaeon]